MEVVAGALPSLIPKLGELLVGEYNLQKEVKDGIIFLQSELVSMQGALEKISKTPSDMLDDQDKIWAGNVREMSYDIEDTLDKFMVRCKGKNPARQRGFKEVIDKSVDWLKQPMIRRKIATEIRDIKIRVEEVAKQRDRYKINNDVPKPATIDPRLLAQYENATFLVGIDDARDEVIEILMQGHELSNQQDKIVSIFGFGGLGKTTLANVVCKKLRPQFHCSAFVSVSQNADMKKLFKETLYQLDKKIYRSINERTLDERQLIDELREYLENKRYLIVIDDIWNVSDWIMIRCALPHNNYGYKIITTTRNFDVAKQVGGAYAMKPLCHLNSKILFYSRIFGNNEEDSNEYNDTCPDDELAGVSDRILKKCAGVPLAIITIASLLASKGKNKMEWEEVFSSVGTGIENNLDLKNMRKILSFSYYDLPSHLKSCLLYLSVFPEDYRIRKRTLIWMWIAEGFIQCINQAQNLFEIGEGYFSELISRSLIQPVFEDDEVEINYCRVHDMVLDIICSLSKAENFVTVVDNMDRTSSSPSNKARRLTLQNGKVTFGTTGATWSMEPAAVRSISVFGSAINTMLHLESFRVLRVLVIEDYDLSEGCSLRYLGTLFHLRYLRICRANLVQLPEEVGNLRFLQTLHVPSVKMSSLPATVVQLKHLKCLIVDGGTRVPNGIGSLTSLEELTLGRMVSSNIIVEELVHLTELRVLIFTCDEFNGKLVECLCKLQKIKSLYIEVPYDKDKTAGLDALNVLPHLRSLELINCGWFPRLPSSMSHSLHRLLINLRELQQEDVETLGRLPALYFLYLQSDHIITHLVIGATLFPSLVQLDLCGDSSVVFRQGAMPRVTTLAFPYSMKGAREMANSNGTFDLGLENLPSLQHATVYFFDHEDDSDEAVAEAKDALWDAAEAHPKRPTLVFEGE